MISGSGDKTIRRWDLRKGKEIEKDRQVVENVQAVGVSRDGRRVVIAGDKGVKVSEVETGIVRTFHEDDWIECIDISADSTLLTGASSNGVRIWNLDTGDLVAGPFGDYHSKTLRFSEDFRKLAVVVRSYDWKERHLEVWDVQTQKLDHLRQDISVPIKGLSDPVSMLWETRLQDPPTFLSNNSLHIGLAPAPPATLPQAYSTSR
jgi:WD40 repeat protein